MSNLSKNIVGASLTFMFVLISIGIINELYAQRRTIKYLGATVTSIRKELLTIGGNKINVDQDEIVADREEVVDDPEEMVETSQ